MNAWKILGQVVAAYVLAFVVVTLEPMPEGVQGQWVQLALAAYGAYSARQQKKKAEKRAKGFGKDAEYGSGLTEEGLSGLRDLDKRYSQRLDEGVLSPELKAAFARRRAEGLSDEQRRRRSFLSGLGQTRLQRGGQLSESAALDYATENERNLMEARSSRESEIGMQEAGVTLDETNRLYDRIDSIRKMVVGVGQGEKDRAVSAMLDSLKLGAMYSGQEQAAISQIGAAYDAKYGQQDTDGGFRRTSASSKSSSSLDVGESFADFYKRSTEQQRAKPSFVERMRSWKGFGR
jgi:hypothetical protein